MTVWFCDRCGKQVKRESFRAGKYSIEKTFYDETKENGFAMEAKRVRRYMKFCDQCAIELEKFLDDEFRNIPAVVTAEVDKRY